MLRVLTWNVAFGKPENADRLYEVLNSAEADVITLNEADHEHVVADLAQRLGMHHVWARGSGNRHVGTLSRYPIIGWQIYNRKPLTQAALATTINYRPGGGEYLTIFNVHLRPDPYWQYEILRYLATNTLLSVAKSVARGSHLIMGDLNTYGVGDPVEVQTILRYMNEEGRRNLARQRNRFLRLSHGRLLRAGYADCYRKVNPTKHGYTFSRHGHLVNRMDYVMADEEQAGRLRNSYTLDGDFSVSDHLPLVAEFAD